MITIFGITFYTLWMATFLFVVTGVIFLIFVWRYFAKRYEGPPGWRIVRRFMVVSFSGLAVLFTIFHWDIILTGIYVDRLCKKEGGLHVYETVEVEGFLDSCCAKQWLEYGFSFFEEKHFKKRFRHTMENGQIKKQRIFEIKSQYEVISEATYLFKFFNRSRFRKLRYSLQDRKTRKVLGELVYFTVNQGWADSFIAIGFNPWRCCDTQMINGQERELNITDLIKVVLQPVGKIKRDIR